MKVIYRVICVLIVFLVAELFLFPASASSMFFTKRIDAANGFPRIVARDMLQSNKGYIWMACSDGILKYNGYDFEWFSQTDDGKHRRFDRIVEDKFRNIWTISVSQELFLVNPSSGNFKCVLDEYYKVREIWALPDSMLCVMSGKRCLILLNRMDDGEWRIVKQHPTEGEINTAHIDREGNCWVLTKNGLYRKAPRSTTFEVCAFPDFKGTPAFGSFSEDDRKLYFGVTDGSYTVYDKKSHRFEWRKIEGKKSTVTAFAPLPEHKLLVGTKSDGFFIVDSSGKVLNHFQIEPVTGNKKEYVCTTFKDSKGRVWIGCREGEFIFRYSPDTGTLRHFTFNYKGELIGTKRTALFYEAVDGIVWIRWKHSIIGYFDEAEEKIKSPFSEADEPYLVRCFLLDRQGGAWLGNENFSLDKIYSQKESLTPCPSEAGGTLTMTSVVFKDKTGRLFVASVNGILAVYDKNMTYLGNLTQTGSMGDKGVLFGRINYMLEDRRGYIWLATHGDGLVCLKPDGTDSWKVLRWDRTTNGLFLADYLTTLAEAPNGDIWVGTNRDGILRVRSFTENSIYYDSVTKNGNVFCNKDWLSITSLCFSKSGTLWFGTAQGLGECVNPRRPVDKMEFKMYDSSNSGLCGNDVRAIVEHPKYGIIVATCLNGICYLPPGESRQFYSCPIPNSRYSFTIKAMTIDGNSSIWGTTNAQVFQYHPDKNEYVFYSNNQIDRFPQYTGMQLVADADGNLYVGTQFGFLYGHESTLNCNSYVPAIVLDNLFLDGRVVGEGESSYLPQALDELKELVLPKSNNSFEIRFNGDDFIQPEVIQYMVRLKGYDKDWICIGNRHFVNYANLPKGHYTLEIKSTDNRGSWVSNTRMLDITILPSFWESVPGILLAVILLSLFLLLCIHVIIRYIRMKDSAAFERRMAEIKTQYMVDLVHEMRTPFTLIQGPIDQILRTSEPGGMSDKNRSRLEVVSRNVHNMMHIINTLLDWQKLKKAHTRLMIRCFDLRAFMQSVASRFDDLAKERNICFQSEYPEQNVMIWADLNKMESILINVISNAFKFTSEGKGIYLSLKEDEEAIVIQIKDEGTGIPEGFIERIFEAFESSPDPAIINQPSTGIGLSLVYELVKMHHGDITCASQVNQGTTFTITLRAGRKHFISDTNIEFAGQSNDELTENAGPITVAQADESDGIGFRNDIYMNDKRVRLLIVDDNQEILQFITEIFEDCCVLTACNGEEGLKSALLNEPDIIITDIIMPVIDGITMLKELRENIQTSHIPVVMLTTKSSIEEQIKGLAMDIDDYITKPFRSGLLKQRINNILERRKRLQALYCSSIYPKERRLSDEGETDKSSSVKISSKEQVFLQSVSSYIRTNVCKESLNVEELSYQMAMSRSVLSRKLKALTGLAPVDFIKSIRLQMAAEYLDTTDLNISEISYNIGFSDPHYFSRCFKQVFKITPTEYKLRKQK